MQDILTNLATYGYIILAIYSFGGGSLALIGASILSAMGKMNIEYVLAIAFIFNFLGDFFFFKYVGFIKKYFRKDFDNIIKKHRRRVAYTKLLIRKKGWIGMFIQKYIYIVKTLYPIMLGVINYDTKKFIILNLLSTLVWALLLGLVSFFFSEIVLKFFN